jgi:GNAT superfamily N-acetyltransferase
MAGGRSTDLREATEADLPAIRAILAAHGNDGAIVFGDVVGPYLRHLFRRGRSLVAVDGEEVVGFGATIDAGASVHLADLFVRSDRLGQGIGRPLLDAVFAGAERRSTFASDDPRAMPLYVRAGMRPWWASLYIEGPAGGLPPDPAGLTTRDASVSELAGIERGWTGHDRPDDWEHWAAQIESDTFAVLLDGEIAGIANARARQAAPIRALNRLVIHPDTAVDPLPVTLAAVRRAARDRTVLVTVQGPNPALRPLLEHGFRIADRDQFMASDPDILDPARLIPNPGML